MRISIGDPLHEFRFDHALPPISLPTDAELILGGNAGLPWIAKPQLSVPRSKFITP
jgi:hypothetical protein